MKNNVVCSTFKEIKETFGLDLATVRSIDNLTSKMAKKPNKIFKYFEKIEVLLNSKPEAVKILKKLKHSIKKDLENKDNLEKFLEVVNLFKTAESNNRDILIRAFSLFLSNLITEEYFTSFVRIILDEIKQNKKPNQAKISAITEAVSPNPLLFACSLTKSGNNNISLLYNPACEISLALQYLIFCNFILKDDDFSRILNAIWLFSYNLLPYDGSFEIINSIDSDLAKYFNFIARRHPCTEFHPKTLSKYANNFIYPAAGNYISKTLTNYINNPSIENTVENVFELASQTRFPPRRYEQFWDMYTTFDAEASKFYHFYLDSARFARTQEEDDLEGIIRASEYLFGHSITPDFIDREGFTQKMLEFYLNSAKKAHIQTEECLYDEILRTDVSKPQYRILFKKLYHRAFQKRKLITCGYELQFPDNETVTELKKPLNSVIKHLTIEKKLKSLIELITEKNINVLVPEYTALSLIYLYHLIRILQTMNSDEKCLKLYDVIFENDPPYTALHGELSCIDLLLVRLARALDNALDEDDSTLTIDITGQVYNEGDFLFNLKSDGVKLTIKPVVNVFVFPHD